MKPRMPVPMGPTKPITLPVPSRPTKMKYPKPTVSPLAPKQMTLPNQKSVPHPEPIF